MGSNMSGSACAGRLPNFLIIGVAKAGTSSLYAYLRQHPQIYVSPRRAPNFFGLGEQPAPFYAGPVQARPVHGATLSQYTAFFAGVQDELAVGEGSSFFNFTPRAAARIQHYLPDAKLLLLLRQPATRAYSQYLYARRMGWEPASTFAAALCAEPKRKAEGWFPFLCYRESSHYAATLRVFMERFPREQIYVALFEDFFGDTARHMREIHQFLGVDPDFNADVSVNHNPAASGLWPWLRSPYNEKAARFWHYLPNRLRSAFFRQMSNVDVCQPSLDPALRTELTQHFRTDILATQAIINRDLSNWLVHSE